MVTFMFVVILPILGFLCFTGPGGITGQKPRH
jgi:hypothetical protein